MDESVYEIVSLAMRYFFLAVAAVIVWRSYRWLFRDRREKHRRLKQLPDAGTIGDMVVIRGNGALEEGTSLPVPWEGDLGCVRSCDIFLPNEGKSHVISKRHLDFSFVNGKGLFVFPGKNCVCAVDGVPVKFRNRAKVVMHHGSVLTVGDTSSGEYVALRLRLFVGLFTGGRAELQHTEDTSRRELQPVPPQQYPENAAYYPENPPQEYPENAAYYPENPQESMSDQPQARRRISRAERRRQREEEDT